MKTAVVGDPIQKRRAILWIVVGIALFVAAIGGGLAIRMWRSGTHNTDQTPTTTLPSSANKAQDLALTGSYADAHQQLNQALNKPGLSDSDKFALFYQQGVTYQNEGKLQQAIDSYKQAEAISLTQSLAESIGDAYAQQGNKEQAISYYKKAIQVVSSSNNPVGGDEKSALEQKIHDQGGQP